MQPTDQHYEHCLTALNDSPLFGQLNDDVLQDMLQIFHYETKNKNDTAISPKQTSDRFYLVIKGRAKVSIYNPNNGREHILFLIGPGDGFDLISLLDGKGHNAIATALDDMEVLFTSVQKAREWVNQHPDFNRAFLPYLGQQMNTLANQVTDLSLYDTEARLARLVLRHLVPDSSPQKIELINDLSQETLASMIGSVRVVVTRHLQHWKQDNIVSGKRGSWTVKKLKTLLEKAESLL